MNYKKIFPILDWLPNYKKEFFEKIGIITKIGDQNCFLSIQEAVHTFEEERKNKATNIKYSDDIKQTNRWDCQNIFIM